MSLALNLREVTMITTFTTYAQYAMFHPEDGLPICRPLTSRERAACAANGIEYASHDDYRRQVAQSTIEVLCGRRAGRIVRAALPAQYCRPV